MDNNIKYQIILAFFIGILLSQKIFCQGWFIAEDNRDSVFFKNNKIKTIKQYFCVEDSINIFLEAQISKDGLIQSMNYYEDGIHVSYGKIYLYDSKNRLVETIYFDNLTMDTACTYISYFQDSIITVYKNESLYFKEIDSSIQDPILIQTYLKNGKLNTETYLKDSDTIIQYKYKYYKTSDEAVTEISFDDCLYEVYYEGEDYIKEVRCKNCSQFNGFFVIKYFNEYSLPYLRIIGDIKDRIESISSIHIYKYDKNQRRKYEAFIFQSVSIENDTFYSITLTENGLPLEIHSSPNEIVTIFKYEFYK